MWSDATPEFFCRQLPSVDLAASAEKASGNLSQIRTVSVTGMLLIEDAKVGLCHIRDSKLHPCRGAGATTDLSDG
jgi:hypothetical protein